MCALEYIDACPNICGTSGASAAGRRGGGRHLPRRKFITGAAPRQHCQRTSSAGIVLAVDPHEVCRGAGGTPIVNNGIVLTSGTALALAFSAGAVLALVQNFTRLEVVF